MGKLERGKLHIFSDFDGTITGKDTLIFLAENLGGGPEMVEALGRLIREGKVSLRDGITAEMRSIRAPFAKAVELLREKVSIDPGFPAFSKWCFEQRIPLTVVSAGFHELIDLFLPPAAYPGLDVLANHLLPNESLGWQCKFRDESEFGHDKSRVLMAARQLGQYSYFVGDGLSDRAAADVADEVCAKHGLAEYCLGRGLEFREFVGFDDLRAYLGGRFP